MTRVVTRHETRQVRVAVAEALGDRANIVLAVSGGIDSMTLLDAAAAVVERSRLIVATFDHGSGAHASDAVALVREVSATLGVEFVAGRAATTLAGEAAFRDARWGFLREVAGSRAAAISTAHTEDDQIETVLMRLMRGAGARGLAALYASSEVVRPLLGVRRAVIERYATAERLRWVEDPTNATPSYFRNRVRMDLLPALRRVDSSIDATLLEAAHAAANWRREVDALCDAGAGGRVVPKGDAIRVPLELFESDAERAARLIWPALAARVGAVLERRGIERAVKFTASARVGSRMQLAGGWQIVRGREVFVLSRSESSVATSRPFALSDGTRLGDWTFRAEPGRGDGSGSTDFWSAWLPSDAPLAVRSWRAGDAMRVGNSGSRRKVKHLLSAAGVSGHERASWPVVLSGEEIVWIPGVRRTDAATARPGRPGLAFVCDYDNR